MRATPLGRLYHNDEAIVSEGEVGTCMYVILAGKVEVLHQRAGKEVHLTLLGEGDFFGEIAIFDREVRSATVRALGEVRVLTVDKTTFLRRIHEDPSLVFRMVEKMSHRIQELSNELTRLKAQKG